MAEDPLKPPPLPKPRYGAMLYPPPTSSAKAKYFDTFGDAPTTTTTTTSAEPSDTTSSSLASTTSPKPQMDTSANALPLGSAQNTAGSRVTAAPTLREGFKTVKWEDFKQVHQYPGVRESLLRGIIAGFCIGGLRFVVGKRGGVLDGARQASNWAVGTFCLTGFANYEYYHYKRRLERRGMQMVVEVMDQKRLELEREKEAKRAERRRKKEEEDQRRAEQEERKARSWKRWLW